MKCLICGEEVSYEDGTVWSHKKCERSLDTAHQPKTEYRNQDKERILFNRLHNLFGDKDIHEID